MSSLQVYRGSEADQGTTSGELDLATIRQRVAKIKRKWSPETVKARAIEGARRRTELAALLSGAIDEKWELMESETCTVCL